MSDASWYVCDVLVARTGGLLPADIHALAQEKTWALLEREAQLRDERSAMAARLTGQLHPIVPKLEDRELRRSAVRLRRDVHNGRCTARTRADLASVVPVLDNPSQQSCERWFQLTEELVDLSERASGTLVAELDGAWQEMVRLLGRSPVRAALALASPEFLRARLPRTGDPTKRAARTAISYLTRAAMKTSPFSFLTTVAPLSLRKGSTAHGQSRITNGTTPLAVELLLAMTHVPELARLLTLRANPSLRERADGTVLGLLPFRGCVDGFFYGDDEAQYISGLAARTVRYHNVEPAGIHTWAERLQAPPSAVARLVRTGALQPVTPWTSDSPKPLAELASILVDEDLAWSARAFRDAVQDAADSERAAVRTDATGRMSAVAQVRIAGARALGAAGAVVPDWLVSAPLVHETVRDAGTHAVAGTPVREDLSRLRGLLAGTVVRSRFYERLIAAFVAEYGPGGCEPDMLTFLLKVIRRPVLPHVLAESAQVDRDRPDTDSPDGLGTLAPATVTTLFQVAAPTPEDVQAGRHLTIVNRLSMGPGGLLTRWLVAPGVHDAAGEDLAAWLRYLTPGAEPLQTASSSDWAPVQYLDTRLLPCLEWPTTLPTKVVRGVPLADIALRHDVASGTLQAFRRRDGKPVSFPYLGSIPRHLIVGAHRLVMTLTDPWVVRARVNGERHTGDPEPAPVRGVVETDRRTCGRLVLQRRTWRMPRLMLPEHEQGETPVAHMGRLRAWAAEHGLPRRFYLRQFAHLRLQHAKPAWVDLANLYSVHAAFRSIAPEAVEVEIVEALPDIGEYLSTDAGAHAVELTAALALGDGR
ncbi:hypothetical protein ACZ90_67165 [Streptomyces albus subsp. albus]|nr:hypothetical protein ACZ90_67165 [Streptomyces albus subsp. albus]